MLKNIVSNTTPIITLLGMKQFELLKQMYEKIIIPEAVYNEIEAGQNKLFYTNLKDYEWIVIEKITNLGLSQHLELFLDKGEAEVIVLAQEIDANLLILDEKTARNYAIMNGYNCTGSFGILIKAKKMGLISNIKPLIEIAKNNGIRMSNQLVQQILSEANEL